MNELSAFDYFSMVSALVLVVSVIAAKVLAHKFEADMRRLLREIGRSRQSMRREVKAAENEKELAERNLTSKTVKRDRTAKRLAKVIKVAKQIDKEEKAKNRIGLSAGED